MRRSLLRVCAVMTLVMSSAICLAARGQDPANPFGDGGPKPVPGVPTPKRAAGPQPKQAAPPVQFTSCEAKIEAVLKTPTKIEFVEAPLKDVVDYLKDCHHIEIQLDEKGLKAAGLDETTPVTMNLNGLPLESALDLILKHVGADWTIHDDVMLITSPARAEEDFLITKTYDVADVVTSPGGNPGGYGTAGNEYDTLTQLITFTVAPKSKIRGATLGAAKVLVVTAGYQAQRKIAKLLEETRAIAAKRSSDALPVHRHLSGSTPGGHVPPSDPNSQQEFSARIEKIQQRLAQLENRTDVSVRPVKMWRLSGHLMVDEFGTIWDNGRPVGTWGVNGGELIEMKSGVLNR
jgi:hypothetical protein